MPNTIVAVPKCFRPVNNFERSLPAPKSDLVQHSLTDPYIFDFLTLTEPFKERELETGMLHPENAVFQSSLTLDCQSSQMTLISFAKAARILQDGRLVNFQKLVSR